MSASVPVLTPHGRGLKASHRIGRLEPSGPPRMLILNWEPFAVQRGVLLSDTGLDIAIAGVGGGKSQVAGAKMFLWGLRHPRRRDGSPTQGLVLGQNFRQVGETQFEEILGHARRLCYRREDGEIVPFPYEAIVKNVVRGQDPRIELFSGVVYRGFSGADVDRMRSFAFDFAWIDESEFQTRESFSMSLNRMRAAEAIRLVVTSSPAAASDGWLWSVVSGKFPEWDELRRATSVRVHRWTSADNPTLSKETLASIRAGMEATRAGISAQELDGKFLGTEEAPMSGPFDWSRGFVGRVNLGGEDARPAVLGVDLGAKHDWTVLVVMSAGGVVLEIERFKESTVAVAAENFFPYVESKIMSLVAKWGLQLIVMDTAWTGAAFSQFLGQRLGERARIDGFKTDQQGKRDGLIEDLGAAMSSGRVRVPSAWTGGDGAIHAIEAQDLFRLECAKLLVELSGLKRHFKHPNGGHDDLIIATALAFHGLAGSPSSTQLDDLSMLLPRSGEARRYDLGGGSAFGGRSNGGGYVF